MAVNRETPNSVHELLVDVGLPVSLEDVKNPTEDVMVNVISEFFKAFNIDVATIKRLTLDQLTALDVTGQENAAIAPLINLVEAMAVIGQAIFIKEFNITDVTSPRQIRTRKLMMLIGNFMLYAKNRKGDIQKRINEVLGRAQQMQELRKQQEDIIERTNNKARETQQKKIEIERMKKELVEREKRIDQNKLLISKNEKLIKEKMAIKTQGIAKNQAKRAELQKRQEQSDQLNARVVRSPDRIRGQLRDLESERKSQEEKRDDIQAALLDKKAMVQKYEEAVAVVRKEHPKLKEVIEDQKKLNNAKKEEERIHGEIEEALRTIDLEEKLGNQEDQQVVARAIQESERQCQERVDKLKKIYAELEAEKKACERKKENLEAHYHEIDTKTREIRGSVGDIEEEISGFLKQCQELYENELMKIVEVHNLMERRERDIQK